MSIRTTIKNILPYYLVARYQKVREPKMANFHNYLENGNSIIQPNFKILLNNPENRKYVKVGNDNMLECAVVFESPTGEVIVGDRNYIGDCTIICKSRIEFGRNIFVAWGSYFYDHDSHSLNHLDRQKDITQQLQDYRSNKNFVENKNWSVVATAPIKICDNAWIGMNVLILKGVTVGEGAIVGAGSVVTKDVEPWTMVAGNPARVVKTLAKPET